MEEVSPEQRTNRRETIYRGDKKVLHIKEESGTLEAEWIDENN